MRVEKITQSKKIPDRWYAELDDGTTLKVNVALIADFGLFTGRELTDEETVSLRASAGVMNAKARALRIIGSRMMSRAEMISRLIEKGETAENAEDAAVYLETIGAINDEEYAAALVRHYSAKGYGLGRIKNELYRRKIPREMWEEALEQMPEENDAIDRFIAQKLRGKEPDKKELKKVSDALIRRGFSWSEVKSAMNRYEPDTESDFDY